MDTIKLDVASRRPPTTVPVLANDEEDVLNVDDIAQLLRVGRNSVYALVGRNALPHRRLGKHIRFSRGAVMRWLDPWSSQGAAKGR